MKTFGERLKQARIQAEMNQEALGKAIGVGQSTIANYEKGLRFPTGEVLLKIAQILSVSIDDLLGHVQEELPTFDFEKKEQVVEQLLNLMLQGEETKALKVIWDAGNQEDEVFDVYEHLLKPLQYEVGKRWALGELDVSVEHYISGIVKKAVAMLGANLDRLEDRKKSIICMVVGGEAHTIGIQMTSEYLKYLGFRVYNIESNVPTTSLLQIIRMKKAQGLAISVTLKDHVEQVKDLIRVLRHEADLTKLKILVGGQGIKDLGQPDHVGADGFAMSLEEVFAWLTLSGFMDD